MSKNEIFMLFYTIIDTNVESKKTIQQQGKTIQELNSVCIHILYFYFEKRLSIFNEKRDRYMCFFLCFFCLCGIHLLIILQKF